jgi:hypothetical protein
VATNSRDFGTRRNEPCCRGRSNRRPPTTGLRRRSPQATPRHRPVPRRLRLPPLWPMSKSSSGSAAYCVVDEFGECGGHAGIVARPWPVTRAKRRGESLGGSRVVLRSSPARSNHRSRRGWGDPLHESARRAAEPRALVRIQSTNVPGVGDGAMRPRVALHPGTPVFKPPPATSLHRPPWP